MVLFIWTEVIKLCQVPVVVGKSEISNRTIYLITAIDISDFTFHIQECLYIYLYNFFLRRLFWAITSEYVGHSINKGEL